MRRTKRGFTLVELMLVVGIMAFLGVAATSGYNALQRGMAERGATAVASGILKAAKERALVDRVPTMVFCYNRMVRAATDTEGAVIVGEAVAVRRAGRLTYVSGKYLADEFADLGTSYDVEDDEGKLGERRGMRLWQFDDTEANAMKYSIVADAVCPRNIPFYSFAGWGDQIDGAGQSVSNLAQSVAYNAYAFYDKGTSDYAPNAWKAGSGYGFEFQTVQLPRGFVFGSTVPSQEGRVSFAGAFYFSPDSPGSNKSVDIYRCQTGAGGGVSVSGSAVGHASSDGETTI